MRAQHLGQHSSFPRDGRERKDCSHSFPLRPKERRCFAGQSFSSPSWLKVSQGGHPAAKTSAGLQYCCLPLILRAACQILPQGAGSAPTFREGRARLQQLDKKGKDTAPPKKKKKAATKCRAEGICSGFMLAGKTEGIRGDPKEMHVGNL